MGRYIARRLLQFIPVMLGALFLLHYMTSVGIQLNGNPARAFFGERTPSAEQLAAVERAFGTDDDCLTRRGDPCLTLFVDRIGNYLQGDFGTDYRGRAVTELVSERFPVTLRLAFIAFTFILVIGIAIGVWSGLHPGKFSDYLVKVSTVIVVSIPVFVLGVAVQWTIGLNLGEWFEDQAWAPDFLTNVFTVAYRADHPWASLVLPGLVLGSLSLAYVARLTRTSLMENMRADYVRTAVAKGLKRSRVVGVHTLRNSLIPVVTFIGADLGALMGGAVVTEGIFNVPGVGGMVFRSVTRQESLVIIFVVTILVVIYLIVNLIVDILYAVLDPRIRYE